LMFFGLMSIQRMGISRLPDVDFPVININLTWEGAAPEVMETDVVDPVEEAMTAIQGVREITSSVREGTANVTIELDLDRDIDVTIQDVQARLSQAQRRLPDDIDPPIVTKTNPEDQPIMFVTATSDLPLKDLMDYVQNHLKDRFTTISGVGEVFLGGFLERNLRVWIDAEKLNAYQLTVQDVISAIQSGHRETPAGRLETEDKELNVRAMGEAVNAEEFGNIVITQRGGQAIYRPIYVKDVATVEEGLADIRRISRKNGEQAVGLGIRKQRGANEVAVGKRVLARLEEVKKDLPPHMKLSLTVDRTKFTKQSIQELTSTLIRSALVTSLVCWFFLGSFRSTLNILLAIPTSILGTFIFISWLGFTLNTFTLLALSLAIGIVVDDAIMVLENIVRYHEKGFDKVEAARTGTSQIAFAAMATTVAIIAIFLPVAFMAGVIGKFFYQFGVTLSIAVALSLLEALTLTPMRCSQFLTLTRKKTRFEEAVQNCFKILSQKYRAGLERSLKHPKKIIVGAFVFFFLSLGIVFLLRKEFIPAQDQSMFFCRLQTPVGSSIDYTSERFKEVEKFIMSRPEVLGYFSAIGGFSGGDVNSGQLFVTLKDRRDRPVTEPYKHPPSQTEVMNYFRKELKKISDLKVSIQDPSLSGLSAQRGFPVEFTILGPNWDQLTELSQKIEDTMSQNPFFTDVDSNYEEGATEIRVYPDRQKASERGVSIENIGTTINALIAGERVAKYTQNGRRYDVRIRLIPSQRSKAEDIKNLWLWNNHGELVQLKDVVTISEKKTNLIITRRNRERAINLHANVATGKSQADAIEEAKKIAKQIISPAEAGGYRSTFGGNAQTFKESFGSLNQVLWLGIIVAYMVLASQFNSYKYPFIILLALPFSISGALIALWLTGQSLNIYSFIGIILLMGIVKKNSILLVEFTNQLVHQGKNVKDALLEACPIRLRPILMTSLATIAAAIPLAMSLGHGSEILAPMAITVIGGIILSTFLTLFVIPCVYLLTLKASTVKKIPE